MKDLFGKAILDFQTNNSPEDLITETTISEEDEMSVAYLFRDFSGMPKIEQQALQLCKGKILDVGCGAGSHSLFLQNQKKLEVIGLDNSAGAIRSAKERGLLKTVHQSIFDYPTKTFDTILMLMNGIGICGIFTYEVAESKCKTVMDLAKKHEHLLQCTMEKN